MGNDANPPAVVWAQGLTKYYNSLAAVDGIDFEVLQGECLGFLGPNGAGKTTTIKMIYGMTPLTAGELRVLGLSIHQNLRQIKRRLGILPQETNLDTELNVLENLEIYANYFDIPRAKARQKAISLLQFLNLEEKINVAVEALSGGMKRRLLLTRALLNDPELLILDEPTTGLDPQARHLIWEKLRELKRQKVTQIVTTHYMEEAAQLCDRVVIMDNGKIITRGAPSQLVEQYVGREVLEIRVPENQRHTLISKLSPKVDTYESHNDLLFFFAPNAEEILQWVRSQNFDVEYAVYRRSTLEDVFLKLTGRKLRE